MAPQAAATRPLVPAVHRAILAEAAVAVAPSTLVHHRPTAAVAAAHPTAAVRLIVAAHPTAAAHHQVAAAAIAVAVVAAVAASAAAVAAAVSAAAAVVVAADVDKIFQQLFPAQQPCSPFSNALKDIVQCIQRVCAGALHGTILRKN